MKSNENGLIQLILVLGIVLLLGAIGWFVVNNKKQQVDTLPVPSDYQTQYQQASDKVAPIEDKQDLDSASAEVDGVSTAEFDAELQKIDSDLNSF